MVGIIKKIEGRVKDSHLQPHPFMVIEVVSMVFGFGNKVARNEDVFLSLTEGEKPVVCFAKLPILNIWWKIGRRNKKNRS